MEFKNGSFVVEQNGKFAGQLDHRSNRFINWFLSIQQPSNMRQLQSMQIGISKLFLFDANKARIIIASRIRIHPHDDDGFITGEINFFKKIDHYSEFRLPSLVTLTRGREL